MVGTKAGSIKAVATIKAKHGKDFWKRIGASGGRASGTGGFASNVVGADGLTGRQRASIAGKIGGSRSTRAGVANHEGKKWKKAHEQE